MSKHSLTAQYLRPHLERDDNHKDLLVLIGKDVLNERPAGANEGNGDEQQGTFQPGKKWI